jgi:hypothetical protein
MMVLTIGGTLIETLVNNMQSFFNQPIKFTPYQLATTDRDFTTFWRAWKDDYTFISTTHSYTTITIGSNDFRAAVSHGNGYVYYFPLRTNAVIRVNPDKTATTLASAPAGGTNPWHGAIISPSNDNDIYVMPYDSGTVAKYSISGNSFTTLTHGIGTGAAKFITSITYGTKIYAMPVVTVTTMLVLDTSTDTFSNIASAKSAANVEYGLPFTSGTKIYYPPVANTTTWRVLDTSANTFTNTYNMVSGSFRLSFETWGGGIAFSDCSAGGTASCYKYDTATDTAALLFTFSTPGNVNAQVAFSAYYAPDNTVIVSYRLGVELVLRTDGVSYSYEVNRYTSLGNSNYVSRFSKAGLRTAYLAATQIYIQENNSPWSFNVDSLMSPFQNKSFLA